MPEKGRKTEDAEKITLGSDPPFLTLGVLTIWRSFSILVETEEGVGFGGRKSISTVLYSKEEATSHLFQILR